MGNVMGGIAEALVATGVGLFVAIPAVVAYNVVQKKIADIEDNVSSINKLLCALLASVGSFEATPKPAPADAMHLAGESLRDLGRANSRPKIEQADVYDAGAEE